MADYRQVSDALDRGVEPELICQTCPWDRLCINPPTMTRGEVEAQTAIPPQGATNKEINEALLKVVIYSGKDSTSSICPVLAVKLRSGDGKAVADAVRSIMQSTPVKVSTPTAP